MGRRSGGGTAPQEAQGGQAIPQASHETALLRAGLLLRWGWLLRRCLQKGRSPLERKPRLPQDCCELRWRLISSSEALSILMTCTAPGLPQA